MHALDLATKVHLHDGKMTFQRTQDCTPILEHCHDRTVAGATGSSDMKHAAKLPFVVIEAYCNQQNITFSEFMQNKEHIKRVLNDPSLAGFRIWKGRV